MNKVKFLFASKFRLTPQFIINALKKITSTFQTIQPLMKELNSLVREKVYNYLNSFSFSNIHTVVIKFLETLWKLVLCKTIIVTLYCIVSQYVLYLSPLGGHWRHIKIPVHYILMSPTSHLPQVSLNVSSHLSAMWQNWCIISSKC